MMYFVLLVVVMHDFETDFYLLFIGFNIFTCPLTKNVADQLDNKLTVIAQTSDKGKVGQSTLPGKSVGVLNPPKLIAL